MSTNFYVSGPFAMTYVAHRKVKRIEKSHVKAFWEDTDASNLAASRGVYVIGLRTNKSLWPVYVGKATKTFRQEVFTDRNRDKVNAALYEWNRARPVVFMLSQDDAGPPARKRIGSLERFLMQLAKEMNPAVQNISGLKIPSEDRWEVVGVTESHPGARTHAERDFRKMMGFR